MGRQAFISALCWMIQGTLAVNLVLNDNLSANNVKRQYRNVATNAAIPYNMYRYGMAVPYGANAHGTVYAHPYGGGGAVGAYTYQVPYVMSPKAAQSQAIPAVSNVKFIQDTPNLYLKDSYGNKYVPTPNTIPLMKPLTPQQFLQLQALPQHLVQPLSTTPLNFNYKRAPGTQQIVYGSQHKPVQLRTHGAHYVYEQAHPGGSTQPVKTLADYAPSNFRLHPGGSTDQAIKSFAEYAPSYFQTHFGVSDQFWNQYAPQSDQSNSLAFAPPTPKDASSSEPQSEENIAVIPIQQQSTSNTKHVSTISPLLLQDTTTKPKQYTDSEELYDEEKRDALRTVKAKLNQHNANVASVKTTVNGKKAIVNIETKPTLPLLDISLLEPLTFDNPILPQVQHYLPKIHDANYVKLSDVQPKYKKLKKEFVIQKSKHYNTGYVKSKPTTEMKKKTPSVKIITFDDEITQASTARPQIVAKEETLKKIPEKSYEINTPGYKEIYQEKAISYNKETNSEPVHYTYGTHKHKEPTHYMYSHSSKEPLHIKSIHYEGHGEAPRGKKPVEHKEPSNQDDHSEEFENLSEENYEPHSTEEQNEGEEKSHHSKPLHREEEYHHSSKPSSNEQDYSQYFEDSGFQPIAQYEEEIHINAPGKFEKEHEQNQLLANKQQTHKPYQNDDRQFNYQYKPQSIEIHHQLQQQPQKDYHHQPQQQSQQQPQKEYHHQPQLQHKEHHYEPIPQHKEQHYLPQLKEQRYEPQRLHQENRPKQNEQHHQSHVQHDPRPPQQAPQTQSLPVHVQEKTKKVYIKEETPVEDESPKDTHKEQDEESEQDFENAYKNAAYGFPAYDLHSENSESDIFNPDNYGIPRQSSDYKAELSPFQQYYTKRNEFPKVTRLSYLDNRDKTKDNYFLDFSINQPQFMADRYTKKVDYLKLYQKQKPEIHFDQADGKKQKKQTENYAAIPYDYYPKHASAQMATNSQEFDYSKFKGEKKNSYAFPTNPRYAYKTKTHFIEPQFQYGFEPVQLPRLLDSELASMASNVSPESEKPGMRKQIYKENFYIKKTSLSNEPNS